MSRKQNVELAPRILQVIRLMEYPKGKNLIKEEVYSDLRYLQYKGIVDFTDVTPYKTSDSLEDTMLRACEFALQLLKAEGLSVKKSIDTMEYSKERPSRSMHTLNIDSRDIPNHMIGEYVRQDVQREVKKHLATVSSY